MPSAVECVRHIRETLTARNANDAVQGDEWDTLWDVPEGGLRVTPLRSIGRNADAEYLRWMTPSEGATFGCTFDDHLIAWVSRLTDEELEECFDATMEGAPPVVFTPWQRLSMYVWVHMPVDAEAHVAVSAGTLQQWAYRPEWTGTRRKHGLGASMLRGGGSMPRMTICDLPTGTGKTLWSLAISYLAMHDTVFFDAMRRRQIEVAGEIVQGGGDGIVGRVVIVAAAPSTYSTFLQALGQLQETFSTFDPTLRVSIVTSTGSTLDVRRMATEANTLTFWVVPMVQLQNVLRMDPSVTIPIVVCDEFTVDTPKSRIRVPASAVLRWIVTQATPAALVKATRGYPTMLQRFFEGELYSPSGLFATTSRRDFKTAQVMCEHYCKLSLATLGRTLRTHVRADLESMMPAELHVHFVRSRVQTVSAHIRQSTQDVIPASLSSVLVHYLRPLHLSADSIVLLNNLGERGSLLTPNDILSAVRAVESREHVSSAHVDETCRQRLITRIEEFAERCPVCFEPESHEHRIYVFSCCGYCTCRDCFDRVFQRGRQRCPFCSQPILTTTVNAQEQADDENQVPLTAFQYPAPMADVTIASAPNRANIADALRGLALSSNRQLTNGLLAMQTLRSTGCRRLLVIVEREPVVEAQVDLSSFFDTDRIEWSTGFQTVRIDPMLSGRGKAFELVKSRFDNPDTGPMALLSLGFDERLMVGTNLNFADGMVVIGHIKPSLITQALARIMRPRPSRDNSLPMPLVYVFTQHVPRGQVRPRD